jgi:hypothetical protein
MKEVVFTLLDAVKSSVSIYSCITVSNGGMIILENCYKRDERPRPLKR